MSLWTKTELLEALKDQILDHQLDDKLEVSEVLIDSRQKSKSGLFLAINGENNNGHKFIPQALANGSNSFIIDISSHKKGLKNFILVKDSLKALNDLAKFSRDRNEGQIIAITGSVGKTTTKEILKLAFETQGKTFATKGNLNNHIGVPLSLANFARDCDYGIFEMGMNHPGEIEPLSKLARPHLALITNVAPVHIEFFKSEEEIALAKAEIFAGLEEDGIALINKDSKYFDLLEKKAEEKAGEIISFGRKDEDAIYQILKKKTLDLKSSKLTVKICGGSEISYKISSLNNAVILNSIIAIACLDLIGDDLEKGLKALQKIKDEAGRGKISEVKIGKKNIVIIDDSYNASLPSILSGINYAKNIKKAFNKNRVVIALGDMLELGKESRNLHEKIINHLLDIDLSILVGPEMSKISKKLPQSSYQKFADSTLAANNIENLLEDGDVLYVKGSRGMKMENLIKQFTK